MCPSGSALSPMRLAWVQARQADRRAVLRSAFRLGETVQTAAASCGAPSSYTLRSSNPSMAHIRSGGSSRSFSFSLRQYSHRIHPPSVTRRRSSSTILTNISQKTPSIPQRRPQSTMSTQADHPTLLMPGPIEFDDAVLQSMSHHSESHVSPGFVGVFSETLSMLRKLFQTTDSASQPFIINGSGTLGWDLVSSNIVEAGENALVLSTGYFGDRFADCLSTYGANVTKLDSPIGGRPSTSEIEKALSEKKYKVVTTTHVDTSTGVLADLQGLVAAVKKVSPETLVIVDGVCSVACEELNFDELGLDAVITAGQKAIGCPTGLSISIFSGKAMDVLKNRKTPIPTYFANLRNWTPIMQNYEAKKPSYFATPSPQLIRALHTSLKQILDKPLAERFQRHVEVSDKVKKAIKDLGLEPVATKPEDQSHAMTAIYLPEGVAIPDVLPKLLNKGVIFGAGLHKDIGTKYIRFGHMGFSVMKNEQAHIDKAIEALGASLAECGYKKA